MSQHYRLGFLWGLILAPFAVQAATVGQIVAQGESRANEGAAAQQRIDNIADNTRDALSEYKTTLKVVDGLKIYNGLLQKQIDAQVAEMAALEDSTGKVALIERQIVPLMVRMIDSLQEFVELDVPFLPDERSKRIGDLRLMLERADVTVAEKFRRVTEAYSIENDYGRSIEAYKDTLTVDGKTLEVDFLRFGRVALMYQSVDGNNTGYWDKDAREYRPLDRATYQKEVTKGLRVARKEIGGELVLVPVAAGAAQ